MINRLVICTIFSMGFVCIEAFPKVQGVDQTPTKPSHYGLCTHYIEPSIRNSSHWCKFGRLGSYPRYPNNFCRMYLKFGRQTVYRGSIYSQKSACKYAMKGSNRYASVAVSTKYLNSSQGGWSKDKGVCGKCVCITIYGGDDNYNPSLKKWVVNKFRGYSFMGKVTDRLGEGCDDSIDILMDRPYSYAPNTNNDNPKAYIVNARKGYRIFKYKSGPESPEDVGVWTAVWNFVPCFYTHKTCAYLMRRTGIRTRPPNIMPGQKK